MTSSLTIRLQAFIQSNAISEGIGEYHAFRIVKCRFDRWSHESLFFAGNFLQELLDAVHPNENCGTRTAIAMVFGQVQGKSISGDLKIHWRRFVKTVLPVHRESQQVDVKLFRLGYVENPQYRNRCFKHDNHL